MGASVYPRPRDRRVFRARAGLALAALLVLAPGISSAAPGDEVEALLARQAEALGGREAWAAIRTARVTGTMSLGEVFVVPFVLEVARPDRARLEVEFQGLRGIRALDGEDAWTVWPFTGRAAPSELGDEDARRLRDLAELGGPLAARTGYGVRRLAARDRLEVLELARPGTEVERYFLDAGGLVVRKEYASWTGEERVEVVATLGDYRRVGGIVVAFSIVQRAAGVPRPHVVEIESVELDVALDDGRFTRPAAVEVEAAEVEGGREKTE